MFENSKWIGVREEIEEVCPVFSRRFTLNGEVESAELSISAIGAYIAQINGERVGKAVLSPGCTSFQSRLQYQTFDVTNMLAGENVLSVTVGKGWYRGRISEKSRKIYSAPCALILTLQLAYRDGGRECIVSDEGFAAQTSPILFSDIYDGERYDASITDFQQLSVVTLELSKEMLIPQEGELVTEHEHIMPVRLITTPKGERVVDLGQNFAGYPQISLTARAGERVKLSFAEILDRDGNFYNDNYRSARAELEYICRDGEQVYKPHFTFYGFRYIRVDEFPGEADPAGCFMGIAIYSDMERRGHIVSGCQKLNKLYENVLWSQRSNFIDIPTDCPQRDERMGWTGDAQVFSKTAAYNYDVLKFFRKWLADVRADQREDGSVPDVVPNYWRMKTSSTAWGDVICIVPWELYLMFGDRSILEENFEAMKKWVDYITSDTLEKNLWISNEASRELWRKHYGDWLALDAPYGSYKGKTDEDRIASAFYYYSCSLVVKAGRVLGRDVSGYERLAADISKTFQGRFAGRTTQTDCVLSLFLNLLPEEERQPCADQLAHMLEENDGCLQTGFVGTPYLLSVLGDNGYVGLAYDLLLNEKHPSWMYEVNHGATTIWEHWDGINDEGRIWSRDMNSYNHYAYGSVMAWVYSFAAGIRSCEEHPGFEEAVIAPHPDRRLGFLNVSLETGHGRIVSSWAYFDGKVRYEIKTPVRTRIVIKNVGEYVVDRGTYIFESEEGGEA